MSRKFRGLRIRLLRPDRAPIRHIGKKPAPPGCTAGQVGWPCWAGDVEGAVIRCIAYTLAFPGHSVEKNWHAAMMLVHMWITPTSSLVVRLLLFSAWHDVVLVHVLAHLHRKMHWEWLHADYAIFFVKRLDGPVPRQHAPAALLSNLQPKHTSPCTQEHMRIRIFKQMHARIGVHG